MKISQMTSLQAADVLARIAEPVANIMHDPEAVKTLQNFADGSDNPIVFIADNLVSVATLLLKSHPMDLFAILAVMSGKTAEEVANQRFIPDTVMDIKGCFDRELLDFFKSQVPSKKTKPTD